MNYWCRQFQGRLVSGEEVAVFIGMVIEIEVNVQGLFNIRRGTAHVHEHAVWHRGKREVMRFGESKHGLVNLFGRANVRERRV